jgi:uncharacterized protein
MISLWTSLFGGMLIGLAVVLLNLLNGRVAGISGITGRLLLGRQSGPNAAFVVGLVAGPLALLALTGALPVIAIGAGTPVLIVAGFLVGFGSRLGSGCTSGHGVAGLARLSPRSLAAVLTFMATGIATVWLMARLGA